MTKAVPSTVNQHGGNHPGMRAQNEKQGHTNQARPRLPGEREDQSLKGGNARANSAGGQNGARMAQEKGKPVLQGIGMDEFHGSGT